MPQEPTTLDGIFLDNANAAYDAAAKRFLSRKIMLGCILKNCLRQFASCTKEEIAASYLPGTPEVGIVPLAPDKTNAPRHILGENIEYKTLTEGTTLFDIRFSALVPSTEELIKIICNIEAQKSHHPGYSLIKRAAFHASRLMSSQYNVEFTEPDFDEIKKVVTIWICMTSPEQELSGITEYSLAENCLAGDIRQPPLDYDLMQLVMVYIGSSAEKTDNPFLKMLHLVFREQLNAETKKDILRQDYGIELDNTTLKELNIMCNLSEGIAAEARAAGYNSGRVEGYNSGRVEGYNSGRAEGYNSGHVEGYNSGHTEGQQSSLTSSIRNLMKKLNMTAQQAMDTLEVPTGEQAKYLRLVNG